MQWRAGAARRVLDVPDGIHLSGFIGRVQPAVGVLDPPYVRVVVLGAGEIETALISVDVLGFEVAAARRIRRAVGNGLGISHEAVLLAATHTHAGPATQWLYRCGTVDARWLEQIERAAVDVAVEAASRVRPAQIAVGLSTAHYALNRRVRLGPLDPTVGAMRIDAVNGEPIATLCHYACHPVILGPGNRHVSAEYPGRTVRVLERLRGGGVALFLNGAAGDVNPAWPNGQAIAPATWTGNADPELAMNEMGQALAKAAWDATERAPWQAADRIRSVQTTVRLSLAAEIESLRRVVDEVLATGPGADHVLPDTVRNDFVSQEIRLAMREWADRTAEQIRSQSLPTDVEIDLQAIAVGPWTLVGVPAEVFAQTALDLKQAHPGRALFVIGYANGNIGYIPTASEYARGGYEVREAYRYYGYPAAVSPQAEAILQSELDKLVQHAG